MAQRAWQRWDRSTCTAPAVRAARLFDEDRSDTLIVPPAAAGGAGAGDAEPLVHLSHTRSLPVSTRASIRVRGVPTLTYMKNWNVPEITSDTAPSGSGEPEPAYERRTAASRRARGGERWVVERRPGGVPVDELHAEPAARAPTQQRRQDQDEAKEQKGATHGTRH